MDSANLPEAIATSRVHKSTIELAVSALLKHHAAQSAGQKPQLLPSDDYVYLILSLKKIPAKARTSPYKISLPHPLLDGSSQLCLIIDDRPKSPTPPSEEIKKLVKSQNIPISKVLKISKLESNYKPFEAKRKLCDSYDLFLVDKRVVHMLPRLIGKQFFKKKKLPLGVDFSKKNLKFQVERALGSALLYVSTGTCCVMKVGKMSMEKEEIVENLISAIVGAVDIVPKKWDAVRSLHLKFYNSLALPLYQVMPEMKLKIESGTKKLKGAELVKLSDGEAEVKELSERKGVKSGKKKKGRIHEVRYMDIGDVENDDDNVDVNEQVMIENDAENREGILIEEGKGDDNKNEESNKEGIEDEDHSAISRSKRKKSSKGKIINNEISSEVNVKKKLVKKSTKGEKVEGMKPIEDGLIGEEKPDGKKGRKKSELDKSLTKKNSQVKDMNQKKRKVAK